MRLREVHAGQTWALRPMRVVRDDDDLLAVWMPVGTPWWKPVGVHGGPWRVPIPPWRLEPDVWRRLDVLQVIERDADGYAPFAIWHTWSRGYFVGWYVNLQSRLRRVADGFEYLDHALDLVIAADGSHRWKDEDELAEYVAHGILTADEVEQVRAHGERVLARAQRRDPPFEGTWRGFRADPDWTLPPLPDLDRPDA